MVLKSLVRGALLVAAVDLMTATAAIAQETARVTVELEAGPVWQSRNDLNDH
jgi:hypothetical protein